MSLKPSSRRLQPKSTNFLKYIYYIVVYGEGLCPGFITKVGLVPSRINRKEVFDLNTYYSPTNLNNSDEQYRRILYYQALAKQERSEIRHVSNMLGLAILLYELVQVVLVFFFSAFPDLGSLYKNSQIFQDSFSTLFGEVLGVALTFGFVAFINRKKYKVSIIPNEKIGFAKCFRWVCFGMLGCMAANYVTDGVIWLFNRVGYDLNYPDSLKPESVFACVLSIVAIAVVPALCEEFALRCCSLGLMQNYGKAFGVVTASIIFGLLHGNVIQLVFAFLVGLFLGYLTVKTGSIWPAILVHGFNNGISASGDVIGYAINGEVDDKYYYAIFIIWAVLGAVSAVWIFLKGEFKNDEPKSEPLPFANSFGAKLGAFASAPLLLLSVPFLIFSTVLSITKI